MFCIFYTGRNNVSVPQWERKGTRVFRNQEASGVEVLGAANSNLRITWVKEEEWKRRKDVQVLRVSRRAL